MSSVKTILKPSPQTYWLWGTVFYVSVTIMAVFCGTVFLNTIITTLNGDTQNLNDLGVIPHIFAVAGFVGGISSLCVTSWLAYNEKGFEG